ncbi:MAG: alpha/beta fold hydrolase [Betaproteobacteria bacterium]|nr:MAG: alpha/beta fold hydrolase [Betaproteobacteria bacterium]
MGSDDRLFDRDKPLEIADQGCFFVGGRYVERAGKRSMLGQMFVQYQVPRTRRHPRPIVMIHGGGQTAVNFLGTPDGRRGWADYFVAMGFAVYLVDQPGRGRSGYFRGYGEAAQRDADDIAGRFTAPERERLWPQAQLHTQWPGDGIPGDRDFDQFYASQVESMADIASLEAMMRDAGSALIERIGPAILLTHSQGGPFGWTIADARPGLVRGILAIEPNGAPVYEVKFTGAPDYFEDHVVGRPWGITRGPLGFDPPARSAADLKFERQAVADAPGLTRCWLQAGRPRRLTNLAGIPILILTAQASYHAPYDHCTSAFLRQAGVGHDFVRLADVGIFGNGHMMMLEKNNLEIARFLREWIEGHVRPED